LTLNISSLKSKCWSSALRERKRVLPNQSEEQRAASQAGWKNGHCSIRRTEFSGLYQAETVLVATPGTQ